MTFPRLLLLTDRAQLRPGRSLTRTVRECARAGLEAVVVREHDLDLRLRRALVAHLADIEGLTVISSRVEDPTADGVQLAAHQSAVARWHGRSCHDAEDVRRAAAEGARYATLSPYTASVSKPGYGPALDPGSFTHDAGIPVLALGGIDPGNARQAVDAGADGVAVMGAVMRAEEPARVVAELLRALE
jgi:thiamine-phosphate pyrophosphorylase